MVMERTYEIGFIDVTIIANANEANQAPSHPVSPDVAIRFRARPQNTGYVYLGFSSADAIGTDRITLSAGDSVSFRIKNSNLVYVAVSVGNEGYEVFSEGPGAA